MMLTSLDAVRARRVILIFVSLSAFFGVWVFGDLLKAWAADQLRTHLIEPPSPRLARAADTVAIVQAVLEHERFEPAPLSPEDDIAQGGMRRRWPVLLSDRTVEMCAGTIWEADAAGCPTMLSDEALTLPGADFRIPRALRLALSQANRQPSTLPEVTGPYVRFTPQAAIDAVFGEGRGWWPEFYRAFPGTAGYVRTSLPVLSEDGTWAVVLVEHTCGGTCGRGLIYLLMRTPEGAWQVVVRDALWIA
ncbi:MAG: hypothetical protein H4O13_07570 [Xanthomonadales bacterium]|nr:hypothetical protein [Xanthomonadales bacterium]